MLRRTISLISAGVIVALAFCLPGCSDSTKKGEPKLADPNAPKLQTQTPPPLGGGGEPNVKGAVKGGVN